MWLLKPIFYRPHLVDSEWIYFYYSKKIWEIECWEFMPVFNSWQKKNVPIFSIATPLASIELAKIVFTASIALEDSYKHK